MRRAAKKIAPMMAGKQAGQMAAVSASMKVMTMDVHLFVTMAARNGKHFRLGMTTVAKQAELW